MTAYTTIPDTDIAQDKPIKAETGLALRDNPIAISEGAAGAPLIQRAAIQNSAVDSTKLNLGTSSASASVVGSDSVEVTMNELSFFPAIYSNLSAGFTMETKVTASRGFRLLNKSVASQIYTVSWRFIG